MIASSAEVSRRGMVASLGWAVLVLAMVHAAPVRMTWAHELRPAYLELRQTGDATFDVLWKVPARGDLRLALYVQFPENCREVGERTVYQLDDSHIERWKIVCDDGLVGQEVAIQGLRTTLTDVLVRTTWSDGRTVTARLDAETPSFIVAEAPNWRQLAGVYTSMGVEHILLGVDHLLFVLGLLLLVRGAGTLIKTITAFTLAHSITLALAVFGVVNVPSQPSDAAIALSIVFLGAEIVHQQRGVRGITARYPWVVAFAFGLLHGLGFAGALRSLGLPAVDIPVALLFFNVGVEIGQLLFVLFFLLLAWSLKTLQTPWPRWGRLVPAYAIGTLATYWFLGRVFVMFGA